MYTVYEVKSRSALRQLQRDCAELHASREAETKSPIENG